MCQSPRKIYEWAKTQRETGNVNKDGVRIRPGVRVGPAKVPGSKAWGPRLTIRW